MTTQLPERLRDLADDAPGPLSPEGMWRTGRSRHRRRQLTVAALVGAVVALTAGAGFGDWQSRRPDPAAPPATQTGPMAIPDEFFEPSPWLPSTSKPGRLLAILDAEQKHIFGGPTEGLVGVAAGSQTYTFLDLPNQLSDSQPALSPDGLHLAYWLAGSPNAVGVLDLRTGTLERHSVLVGKALADTAVRWTGDSTLALEANWFIVRHGVDTGAQTALSVTLRSQDTRRLPRGSVMSASPAVSQGLANVSMSQRAVEVLDPVTGRLLDRVRLSRKVPRSVALNPSGARVAAALFTNRPGDLVAGPIRGGRAVLATVPGGPQYLDVLGWQDGRHLVATRYDTRATRLVSVDVRTGRTLTLSRDAGGVELAADAVTGARSVAAVSPPRPWNVRAVLVWALVGLSLISFFGYVALTLWRQRVRS